MRPVMQALVLADQVYVDAATQKKVIAGTFTSLWSFDFPARLGRTTWAYVSLTEVRGAARVRLRYRDLQSNEVLLESPELQLSATDPLATLDCVIEVPPFPMPHAGAYAFELHVEDELIGSLRITVGKREVKSDG